MIIINIPRACGYTPRASRSRKIQEEQAASHVPDWGRCAIQPYARPQRAGHCHKTRFGRRHTARLSPPRDIHSSALFSLVRTSSLSRRGMQTPHAQSPRAQPAATRTRPLDLRPSPCALGAGSLTHEPSHASGRARQAASTRCAIDHRVHSNHSSSRRHSHRDFLLKRRHNACVHAAPWV